MFPLLLKFTFYECNPLSLLTFDHYYNDICEHSGIQRIDVGIWNTLNHFPMYIQCHTLQYKIEVINVTKDGIKYFSNSKSFSNIQLTKNIKNNEQHEPPLLLQSVLWRVFLIIKYIYEFLYIPFMDSFQLDNSGILTYTNLYRFIYSFRILRMLRHQLRNNPSIIGQLNKIKACF